MIQQNKVAFDYKDYLTIEALEDDISISFGNDIEYGIDGYGWVYLPKYTNTPPFKLGQLISFRGELTPNGYLGIGTFTISKKFNLKGNCMSMLFGDNAPNNYSLRDKNYAFCALFENCTTMISVSDNFLPATTLSNSCYARMFHTCTNLTTAPELPATTLKNDCYERMFRNCSKLNYIKMLATDISATSCLNSWAEDVASTGTFVKNPAMTSLPTGTSGIPEGWTVVNDGEESGGSKTINYIRMSYEEVGPDEYHVSFRADFVPASRITFEMGGMTTNMGGNTTIAGLAMISGVPTLERLTYSPKEDDTYIYEVIMA